MSINVMSIVWKNSRNKGSVLLLELAIADHAHDDGTGAWPSVDALARKIRMSTRATQKILRKLEKSREMTTLIGAGPHGCNAYRIEIKRIVQRRGEKFSPRTRGAAGVTVARKKFTGGVNNRRVSSGERADTQIETVIEPSGIVKGTVEYSNARQASKKEKSDEPYSDAIAQYALELSQQHLHDYEHRYSNVSNAMNRWRESGLSEEKFIELMQKAKLTALLNTDHIHHTAGAIHKNRAPYFFAVLRDLIQKESVPQNA